jgi:hypothetical protein
MDYVSKQTDRIMGYNNSLDLNDILNFIYYSMIRFFI